MKQVNRKSAILVLSAILILASAACRREAAKAELFHRFPDQTWRRFNLLSFEIPVTHPGNYDISLFAVFTREYPYPTLDFNMIMNTPAGEERTNEYIMEIKGNGVSAEGCTADSCTGTIMLKKGLNLSKKGMLKIQIENLIPKIATSGIRGVGIRLAPSTQ
ncbi:MAG TPA: hypothetical protein PKG48_00240 [Bacteroidales bacterium]|nr:hypothetical protein [Bacteroidales bacterium]